jgi:hypothetical protein
MGLTGKPYRHNWQLSSNGKVKGDSLEVHVKWLLSQMKLRKKLSALREKGFRVQLSCFFETRDFGGGPVVTREVVRLLAYHGLDLEFDIYPIK